MHRAILHVDMDAFFCAVERRDQPHLCGLPIVVGHLGPRAVVSAASYEARVFGCRSAQPVAVARRLCPNLVVVPPRYEAYVTASREAFAIFSRYTPLIESLSLDEAFLDVSASLELFGPPQAIGAAIREDVRKEIGLTCSVGIATSKLIAKLATESAKPDGLAAVAPGSEAEFLAPRLVGELWGIGRKTNERLATLGIVTIGQLAQADLATLATVLGRQAHAVQSLARGCDDRPVEVDGTRVRMSCEHTFERDVSDIRLLERQLLLQAERLADRLVAAQTSGHTVHLKLRDASFHTKVRQLTCAQAIADTRTLYRQARLLLQQCIRPGTAYRLIGLGLGSLLHGEEEAEVVSPQQLSLFAESSAQPVSRRSSPQPAVNEPSLSQLSAVQQVKSAIRSKFGDLALRAADGAQEGSPEERRAAQTVSSIKRR